MNQPNDYFYGPQSEQFSFYRIPKVLFSEERYSDLCAEAKILYDILLDRMENPGAGYEAVFACCAA